MVVTEPPPQHEPDPAVEGGVIDDARERQRRHRRLGAALVAAALALGALIFALVGGGGGSGASQLGRDHAANATPGAHTPARTPAPSAPGPGSVSVFGLLARGVGWVGDPVYVTRNSGRSWVFVPPKTLGSQNVGWTSSPGPRVLAISYADGGQNALTIPRGASAPQWIAKHVHGHIAVTTNAARTWRLHAFVPGKSPGAISFLNDRQGFALGYTAAAHHDPRASLYETHDGARTWTRIARRVPFTGLLSFANTRDGLGGGWGFAAGRVDSAAIYRTSDGGRSWTRTPLCGKSGPTCETPKLFRSGRGVVPVTVSDPTTGRITRVEVYATRDNGVGWTRHTLPDIPTLPDDLNYIPFSAPNANDLFAWVTPYLYASHDGGRSWSRYAEPELNPPGFQPVFGNIGFANRNYGWYTTLSVFAYTTDGGKHWTKFRHTR